MERYIIINVHSSSIKVPVINKSKRNLNFLDRYSKHIQKLIIMKNCPVIADLNYVHGRTSEQKDMIMIIDAFSYFANSLKFGT